jgi:transcriptional regulator with XRE-family HTH domain
MPTPSDVVAGRVREVRRKRGLTVAQLAERCAELGMPGLTEQAIYNLEAGRADKQGRRRRAVTVDELLALSLALDVAPVHLLVSPDTDGEPQEITPARVEPASAVRDWVRGVPTLDGIDPRAFFAEVDVHEWRRITDDLRQRAEDPNWPEATRRGARELLEIYERTRRGPSATPPQRR